MFCDSPPSVSKSAQFVPGVDRQISIEGLKRSGAKVDGNDSATLWNLNDGILLLEFHTKMNSIDTMITDMMHKSVDIAEKDYRGLVIGNDGGNFSAGANIAMLLWAIKEGQWNDVKALIGNFQKANQRMRYSSIPVVTAPFGLTLGGGTEVTMGGTTLRVGIANGLVNASTLLDKVVSGEEHFDIIEVMACPGGCIGGGGQPYPPRGMQALDPELMRLRARALYEEDRSKALRRSHQNPAVQTLYTEFLGEIGGHKAHELLHTTYRAREPRGIK